MATTSQITANQANAQHSTGPRTDGGKAASSGNSLKHGLTAKSILLPGEDEAAYHTMCEGMFEKFSPDSVPEKELIQLLCDTQWRLQRCGRIEAAILSAGVIDFKALDIVSKHEARLKKQYSVTLKEARGLIDIGLRQEAAEMAEAVIVRRADRKAGRERNLQEIGFVFSNQEVDAEILHQDALLSAPKTTSRHDITKDFAAYMERFKNVG